jgi:tRNA(Ile)-lysidine synthase
MDGSRRSRPADAGALEAPRAALAAALDRHGLRDATIAVALSGGRDSIALLDAAAEVSPHAGVALLACHVHHGLSAHADAWSAFCATAAARRGIAFNQARVAVKASRRDGVEAAARRERYRALGACARAAGARAVLLAHHQDDQAETLLLQLVRGAGPRGLAAMPSARIEHGILWLRPWLDLPRAAIEAYCAARDLAWIDDDSNTDARYRRNALRHTVVPVLRALAPGYPATLARAAAHQAEASELLQALAASDAAPFRDERTLARAALTQLPAPRARNVLRWFLHERGLPPPSSARFDALFAQLATAAPDASVRVRHAGCDIGIHRGRIDVHLPPPEPFELAWTGAAPLVLPHGDLRVDVEGDGGIDLARLFAAEVIVRSRSGGERVHVDAGSAPSRAVRSLMREAALPTWVRAALPLVFADGALAVVPGVAVDVAFRAAPGTRGGSLVWSPRPAPTRGGA